MEQTKFVKVQCNECETPLTKGDIEYTSHGVDSVGDDVRITMFRCHSCDRYVTVSQKVVGEESPEYDWSDVDEDIPYMFGHDTDGHLTLRCARCFKEFRYTDLKYNNSYEEDGEQCLMEEYKCDCGCRNAVEYRYQKTE